MQALLLHLVGSHAAYNRRKMGLFVVVMNGASD